MDSGIIRVRRSGRWAAMNIGGAEDPVLSWEARGVLWYLLAKPNGWQVRLWDLIDKGSAGRDKMRRILRELEAAGYLRRIRVCNPETGRFDWISEIYEEPIPLPPPLENGTGSAETAHPSTENTSMANGLPSTCLPSTGEPSTGEPSTVNTSIYHDPVQHDPTYQPPPPPTPPARKRRGGGGGKKTDSAPTPTERFLIDNGFSPTTAREFRDFPLADAEADYARRRAEGAGIGAIVAAWRVSPPRAGESALVERKPSDMPILMARIHGTVKKEWLDRFRDAAEPADKRRILEQFREAFPAPGAPGGAS